MRLHYLHFAIFVASTLPATSSGQTEDECVDGYTLCSPLDATATTTPEIGSSAFRSLFVDIVLSSLPPSKRVRSLLSHQATASLCCTSTLSCLTMTNLGIPFCYDKFTTNYFLPDGSYGTVIGGEYTSSGGDVANLETGFYTLVNGQTGNIYTEYESEKPNTATLPMPSQFTASGVGTAIQASALGAEVTITYTTTLPGSTMLGTTVAPITISPSVVEETIFLPSTVQTGVSNSLMPAITGVPSASPSTVQGSVIQGTTILGTTVSAVVTTVTTTMMTTEASKISGASGTSTTSGSASATTLTAKSAATGERGPHLLYLILISFSGVLMFGYR
jgi:hypothetical protein